MINISTTTKTYTAQDVFNETLKYFNNDSLATSSFVGKYALRRKEGDEWVYYELTPDDMHKRIAAELYRIECNYSNPISYEEIYNSIKDFKYIVPQGSPMAGIGNPFQLVSLSNCVVIDGPQDSISKIMDTAKDLANLSKRRCGVGSPMDNLRPEGTKVNNSAGTSTGAWSFCHHFSNIAGVIGQGGRRAALMLSMSCRHPDIEKFIIMKHDRTNTTNANVSIMITNEFMQAVVNDSDWDLVWPIDSTPETAKVHKVIKAKDLWRLINESATYHAEPGLLFWDNYLDNLPAECYAEDGFKTICVNPCCFSEDSEVWVPTKTKTKEIKTITSEDEVWVDSEQKYVKTSGYFRAGTAEVFLVEFSNGETLEITANHKLVKFQTDKLFSNHASLELVELQNLKVGDLIATPYYDSLQPIDNTTEIISIESKGIKPVGCIEVPEYHQFVANGICSGNSEIALSAYDSCRLMSINLKNFVINPFEKDAYFDFDLFNKMVCFGQRFMDDIVDLEIEALDNIINSVDDDDEKVLWGKLKRAAIEGRRTGLGTHALADCLACLCIKYDSQEANDVVDKIYETFRNSSYMTGTILAEERGTFPCFRWEKEKNNIFIQRLPDNIKERIQKFGRRNIAQLTMAPTGTVSIESQTSSGVEPVFRIYYSRKKKINPSDVNANVDFEDVVGNKWQIFDVFHHNILDYFKKNPEVFEKWENIKDKYPAEKREEKLREILPEYFISSDQIDWNFRVDLQGIIQSYICHGISSTINLPRNTPVEEVENIYMRAWEKGLKGVTVYVEGSREDVLSSVSNSDRPSDISETHAPKRPSVLSCDIHYSNIDNLQWTIFVSKFNNAPYEIFAGLSENVDIPKKYSEGFIKKRNGEKVNAKGRITRYDLIVGDNNENKKTIEDIVVTFDNPGYATQTRLISCLLRHGVPVSAIVEQLSRDLNENLFSFNKVIARVLKKYIKDGASSGENCSSCGAKLRFESGCYICPSCGDSKCG